MTPHLICIDAAKVVTELIVNRLPAIVGRDETADVRINNQRISRLHCRLEQIEGRLFVRDLGSRNGIMVNGEPVGESKLEQGDTVTFGMSTFVVHLPDQT